MTSIPDRVEGVPCGNGRIELFRDKGDREILVGVVETTILKTAANVGGFVSGDTVVNEVCIDSEKRVNGGV